MFGCACLYFMFSSSHMTTIKNFNFLFRLR